MRRLAQIALGASLAMSLAGCMSMDEMLASEDGFWRDIGETKAVAFAIDGANPLEKRLEIVPKIANQQKLAKIVIAKDVSQEVKSEARKRIDETAALAVIALDAPDRGDRVDALKQINKSEDSRIEAAWIFIERKPSSNAPQTLLKDLSDPGKAKFAKSFVAKVDAAVAASEEAGRLRRKYGDSMAAGKIKELNAILQALVKLAPCLRDEAAIEAILKREDVADVKGTEFDFLTPLEGAYQRAVAERKAREAREFLASITDDERVQLLEKGSISKQGKTLVATDGAVSKESKDVLDGDAGEMQRTRMLRLKQSRGATAEDVSEDAVYNVSRDEVIAGIKDSGTAEKMRKDEAERKNRKAIAEAKAKALKEKREKAFSKLVEAKILKDYDINHISTNYEDRNAEVKFKLAAEYLGKISYYEGTSGVKKWMQAIDLFKDDPELQQELAESIFNHAYSDFDDPIKLAELKKVMAVMPMDKVMEIFRANITDRNVELKARAIAYGITDQAVLKTLLVDDDSWARPRTKNCDLKRRKNVYSTLLDNVKDTALADKIFCETRPTKNTDVIAVGDILGLIDRISESKRKELTDRAFARAEEVAKSAVVVEKYYVGMSYLDYTLVNHANGGMSRPGLSLYDDNRNMTTIGFTKECRIKKLGITESNAIAACRKFGAKYGTVPDGKDVSGKTDVVVAIRTQTAFDDNAPGGTSYSHEGVWKWIDYVHDVQAEINNDTGTLVLCKAVIEGEFNNKDIRQDQQNAILDAFADLASDDDDKDMGPDPGLEPVGK